MTDKSKHTIGVDNIESKIITQFEHIVGKNNVLIKKEELELYGSDKTEDYVFLPQIVLRPSSTKDISDILHICHHHYIPITPRGGGTGLAGGALPIHGGVVLSMEYFNKIIAIDEMNLQVTVEPGVITEVLQKTLKAKGLFYPPDPASKGSCFIGGNLANNSGGPKATKYGVTRDYVINMEVVLPTGEIIWTGANVLKNSTGYNLTQLMCGSEGTLGIITKVVFKLKSYPQKDVLLLIPFASNEKACQAVSAIYKAGITPSGLEFFEHEIAQQTITYCKEVLNKTVATPFPSHMKAYLLCEMDGNDIDVLMKDAECVMQVVEKFDAGDVLFADNASEKESLWMIRKNISPAINWKMVSKSDDVVVPRYSLPKLITGIKAIGKKYNCKMVCFGHLGDGNLHINIPKHEMSESKWNKLIPKAIGEIFELTVALGGTLSGEHGIGIAKKPYMHLAMHHKNIALMKGIKKVFDPHGILNPGKIF